MNIWQQVKYTLIVLKSIMVNRSVVTFFNSTYVVSGMRVQKIGGKK